MDFKKIFNEGENDRIEFKKSLATERQIFESIGAFLNHKGGKIIIGYDEQKQHVAGIQIGTETIQNLINKVKQCTNPPVVIDAHLQFYNNKQLLIIEVIDYPIKPVAVNGKYLRRFANGNHPLTAADITNLHLASLNSSWDYQLATDYNLKDVDMDIIEHIITKINKNREIIINASPLSFLKKFELVRNNLPTYAALLLAPKQALLSSEVQIGLFEDDITIKKSKTINKGLVLQADEIMDFITAYIHKEIIVSGKLQHIEKWQYPLNAIRELVINAVVHRDYQEGTHTQIKVFRNKIEFWNSGKLPVDITLDEIKQGTIVSRPRNKLLANIFKEIGYIEKYGSGLKRVIKEFKDYGLREPQISMKNRGFFVVACGKGSQESSQEGSQESSQEDKIEITDKISMKILELMRKNPKVTIKKIAAIFLLSDRTIKNKISELKKQRYIERRGSTKSGSWKVLK